MKFSRAWKKIGIVVILILLLFLPFGLTYKAYEIMQPEKNVENLIHLEVREAEHQEIINAWLHQEEDVYYFFLPSHAKMCQCYIQFGQVVSNAEIDGNVIVQNNPLDKIELNHIYSMTYKTKNVEQTIKISFAQSAKIHTVYIDTVSRTMDYIHKDKGNEETGNISIVDSNGIVAYEGRLEQIRARGNNTWYNDKKAYQLKLDQKADLLGMGEAKTWILLAGAADGSAIRNKLVFDMAKELGIKYAQDAEYVDLYLNGEYAGNYLLSEKIQIKPNRVDITSLEKETEKINGGSENLQKATPYLSEDGNRWGYTDAWNPQDITGGYLLERDNYFEEEPSAFRLKSGEKFSISSPKYATKEEVNYIADAMQHVENAILAEDGIDPETGKDYRELIDFDGLVYKYLFDEVTKCDDGWRGSNYFYKMPDEIDTKIYCGPIWDYDLSLGNAPEWFVGDEKPEGITQTRLSKWFSALWKREEFRNAVIDTYNEVFKPYMLSMIADGGKIDQNVYIVGQSAKMNLLRWQWKKELSLNFSCYEEQITFLKSFIENRLKYLDEVWNEGVVYHEVLFRGVPKEYDRTDKYDYQYILDGECLTVPPIPSKENAEFIGWYYLDTEEELDPNRKITEDVTLEAHWKELQTESINDITE